MKLLIVRHADPDYSIDSLTPAGWEEAELLSGWLTKLPIDAFYVSPLGRAKDTASLTLKKLGKEAAVCDWLQEFPPKIMRPDAGRLIIPWDWLPAEWTKEERYFDHQNWYDTEIMNDGHVGDAYRKVIEGLDQLLAHHGYRRKDLYYQAEQPNRDTIVLFCHFGVECVLLSHLLNISPMALWHGFCAAPSSVTTLVTEERREGAAYFRIHCFGSTAHLDAAGRTPSVAARFCETFTCKEERHD